MINVQKNLVVDEAPGDKRRKTGSGRAMHSTSSSRGREVLTPVNNPKEVSVAPSETEVIEFTKEEVDALLNDKFKGKPFDPKVGSYYFICSSATCAIIMCFNFFLGIFRIFRANRSGRQLILKG